MRRFKQIAILLTILIIASGCVYYNTFYYARKAFNEAESKRKEAGRKGGKSGSGGYNRALDKSQIVLEKYPNSSWYDDALFVNGVSSFYMGDYSKAEKRFRELIANYPKSEYVMESRLYLAKTKLKLGEETEAMSLFEIQLEESKDKTVKSQAAVALGEYYFGEKDYVTAEKYFNSLIDSLGATEDKIVAQMYVADGQYVRFNYKSALENYLKVLALKPVLADEYRATFRAGECCFYLNEIEDGMTYFNKLAQNNLFYDSLSAIRLMIAFGHELDGDLPLAERTYKQVALEDQRQAGSMANYNLGLIYQFDYEDYKKAKEYYDLAKRAGSGSGIYHDALQRSTDIGKLQEYSKRKVFDSTSTQEEIDEAARTQYLLAELYLIQMGKPDSAMQEFRYVAQNFPEAYIAPKAMIAIAQMLRDSYDDTLGFDTTLRVVLGNYPRSDFAPEAIALLGLSGTLADTGYAGYYYHKGENFSFDDRNIDSAKYYFSIVADSFPRSTYNKQARYALLWLKEMYENPEDSSLYFAYANFADSFGQTEYGKAAIKKLAGRPKFVNPTGKDENIPSADTTAVADAQDADTTGDSTQQRTLTPEEKYFIGPDGNTLFAVQGSPLRVDREFKYPPAAYTSNFEGFLYFQIRIDPFGDVVDLRLMNPTPSEPLNQEAYETVKVSHWDTRWIPPQLYDSWFVYKYLVQLPRSMK